jgi:hypothetical protein
VQEPEADVVGPPKDLIGLDLIDSSAEPEPVIQRIGEAIAAVAPNDVELSIAVLSPTARTTALGAVAPIGAGGDLEVLAAACAADPANIPDFVEALLGATLFLPAVGEDVADAQGGNERNDPDAGTAREAQVPREVRDGEQVEYPVLTIDGQETIAAFSSRWALLHADPPFGDQLEVSASRLLANWPDGVAFALDLGSQRAMQVPADDAARLRQAVLGG